MSPPVNGHSSSLETGRAASAVSGTVTVRDVDFTLVDRLRLPDPILALRTVDMTSDGLLEIGVLSLKGLHILQVHVHLSSVHLRVEPRL